MVVSHNEFVLIPYEGNTTKVVTANTSKHRKRKRGWGKVSEYDSAFYKLIEEIDSKLQSSRALHTNYLNITFQNFLMDLDIDASVASTYRKEKLKNRLVKHYGTKIVFQPQLNPSLPELVFSNGVKLQDVINAALKLRQDVKFQDVKDEFQTTSSNEAERILYLDAKILQKELQATVRIQYSPVNPDDISQDNAEAIVPNKLFSFLHLLMTLNKNGHEI